MAEVIRMPRLSDTMEEGTLVAWHKKEGDEVEMGDVIAEIETDKATMDFESPEDGTILHIGIKEGESVPVNEIIAVLGEKGEDYEAILKKAGGAKDEQEAADEPAKKEAKKQEAKAEAETGTSAPTAPQPEPSSPPSRSAPSKTNGRIKASPLAKRLAKEKGIELTRVEGSGDNGRIVKRDIEAYEERMDTPPSAAPVGKEGHEDVPVTQMRKTIAKRLSESKYSAPHYYLNIEVNMDRAIEARKNINEIASVKVSFNDLIMKAAAAAIRKNPQVNASWLDDKIRYYEHIHLGMAVAIEEGLIVPVIRFADTKSLSQLATESKELAQKAKNRELEPADWEGNTFSISNLGMYDIEDFTAIINSPDVCIMAVGTIKEKPIAKDGELTTAHMMKVTLSCDHRVVDGATGAEFLQTFKRFLEDPVLILA